MKSKSSAETRARILSVAERRFAATGFAGTSLQDIVSGTGFTKPVIYYYFGSKAGLFNAVLEDAYDQCYEIMRNAAAEAKTIDAQLLRIARALFAFFRDRKALTRLAFSAAFAASHELPKGSASDTHRLRNFNFFHGLIREALKEGRLDDSFDSRSLTYGIYGALSFYMMANVLMPGTRLDAPTARNVVELFLCGAARGGRKARE